jgi:protein TonB
MIPVSARVPHTALLEDRYRLKAATAVSVAFHVLVVLAIGLLVGRAPLRQEVLIPIELLVTQQHQQMQIGGTDSTQEVPRPRLPLTAEKTASKPSNTGPSAKAASSSPKTLTTKSAGELVPPTGEGVEPSGLGGGNETPAGASYGPSIVGGPLPVYPKHALDQGLEGRVVLSVNIGGEGTVQSVTVEKSSGYRLLDEAAMRTVQEGWVFQPGVMEGKPVPGKVTLIFDFSAGAVRRG